MAESFTNSLTRAVGVVTSVTTGSIGIQTNLITGIVTTGIGVSAFVDNQHYIAGTKVLNFGTAAEEVVCDRDSTNTAAATSQSVKFLGATTSYTSTAGEKAILIGGTFANNTESAVNIWIELHDSSSNTVTGIGQKIPVPTGSSFVLTDAGKTVLETSDSVRIYCDTANGIDATLSILKGVS